MTHLTPSTHRVSLLKSRKSAAFLFIVGMIFVFALQPSQVKANTAQTAQGSIDVIQIDASKLSTNHPYVTVWLENTNEIASGKLSLDLSYLSFPKFSNGKSWKNINHSGFIAEPIALESLEIRSLMGGERLSIELLLKPKDIVRLNNAPTTIIGKIRLLNETQLLSYQIGFTFPHEISMVHATALAFDNPNYASGNLAPQIQETLSGIAAGSELNKTTFSIVVADAFGAGDTKIYFVHAGNIIPASAVFAGLPDHNGRLSASLSEYDMGDGEVLGGYLQWVRKISNDEKLTFSFYGHGGALMPDIAPQTSNQYDATASNGSGPVTMPSWVTLQPSWVTLQPSWVTLQPSWVTLQPSWVTLQPSLLTAEEGFATDMHPVSLISIKDLATAVKKGSDNGNSPIAVLDLVHCFSLSIEEVHELAPYTETIIGSANYHFFDARMPGHALRNINGNQPAEKIASSMMNSYDETLPQEGYPRTMAVIRSDAVADIKTHWDQTSAALITAFANDHGGTRHKLQQAYHGSTKYDSTSCDSEFGIGAPDALVDFYELATQIETQFADNLSVAQPAQVTANRINDAVIAVINRNGLPWFSTNDQDTWSFTGKGMSIYADLVGLPDEVGRYSLSWQSAFYNRIPNEFSPVPFDFVASEEGQITWADVVHKSWEGYEVAAQGCIVSIPLDQDRGEVSLSRVTTVNSDSGSRMTADFNIDQELGNLMVLFELSHAGEVIYSEQLYTGWLDAGSHSISTSNIADGLLFSTGSGEKTITVTLDPNQFIVEENKEDNQVTISIE